MLEPIDSSTDTSDAQGSSPRASLPEQVSVQPASPATWSPESLGRAYYERVKGPNRARIAVVVGGFVALVVAATVTIGASPAPGATPSPAAGQNGGGGRPFDLFRGRGGRGFEFERITISAINGSSLSLKTDDGWARTITVTSATTITKGGQSVALGDLKVGDPIRFRQTRNADGSYAINAIEVVVPRAAGTVTAVTADGFTLSSRDGTTWSVTVTGATVYSLGRPDGNSGSKSDVKVGSEVLVEGTQGSGNTLTALRVHIAMPHVAGEVTAKSGNTITVRRPDGTSASVRVGSGTTYRVQGVTNATLANITVGMVVLVEGTQNSDASLDATTVAGGQLGRKFAPFRGPFHGPFGGPEASPSPTPG